LIFKGVKKYIR